VLHVLTDMVAATDMAPALAPALELPGKRRSGEDQYRTVQPIYCLGFTIGGLVGEADGRLATLILALTLEGADLCRLVDSINRTAKARTANHPGSAGAFTRSARHARYAQPHSPRHCRRPLRPNI
jgi:hypothetical protein